MNIKKLALFHDLSWTFISQLISNMLSFLTIFFVVRCYSQEEFGLWASITSLAAVLVTGDFGLTNVLRNIASKGLTEGQQGEMYTKEAWFSTVFFLSIFALAGLLVLILFKDSTFFEILFKTDNEQLKVLGKGIVIMVIGLFLIRLPLGLSGGLFLSYGEIREGAIFSIIGSSLTFIVVVSLSLSHLRIDYVSVSFFICPLLVQIVSTCYFLSRRKWGHFRIKPKVMLAHLKLMLPTGFEFLGISFAGHLIPNALTLYSGAMLGLSFAANINVAVKIFNFFSAIMIGLLNPLWARLSRHFYNGEFLICRRILRFNLFGMMGASILILLCVSVFRELLVSIIAGDGYEADMLVFVLVGTCLFGKAISDSASLLLYATNHLRTMFIGYMAFSLVALFVFPEIVGIYGFNSMMGTMIICWLLFIGLVLVSTKRLLKNE